MFRLCATFFSFIVLGANDAAYGALIPYLEEWYNVNYTVISLIFLSPIMGYTMSALLINHIHVVYGQRGVAWLMGVSHLLGFRMYPAVIFRLGMRLTQFNSCCLPPSSLSCTGGGLYCRWIRERPG